MINCNVAYDMLSYVHTPEEEPAPAAAAAGNITGRCVCLGKFCWGALLPWP